MIQTNTNSIFCAHGPKQWPTALTNTEINPSLKDKTLAVKDLFKIAGYRNSAGNPQWYKSHAPATNTAKVLLKLQQAGTKLLGFTHTDELAYSLEGNNIHYGAADNPKLHGHTCGGSSMGSAAAVAHNLADIGLGTDTGGSIRVPASYCGLYGIRPSHNAISSDGLIGLAPEFDTIGWLTQDASLLNAVGRQLLPQQQPQKIGNLYVCDKLLSLAEPPFQQALQSSLTQISKQFTKLKSLELPDDLLSELADTFRILQGRAIAKEHQTWLNSAQPNFAPEIEKRFNMALALTEQEENNARVVQLALKKQLQTQLSPGSCLFMPTTPTSAPEIGADVSQLRIQIINLSAIAGLTGSTQIHLPLTPKPVYLKQQMVPYGFSLLAPSGQDLSLLNLVESISQLNWEHF